MFDNNYFGGYDSDALFTQADFWEEMQEFYREQEVEGND